MGSLPRLIMVKARVDLTREPDWSAAERALEGLLDPAEIDRRDGLRLARGPEWVHLRKSGTEPIIRVIAESPDPDRARELVRAAENALA